MASGALVFIVTILNLFMGIQAQTTAPTPGSLMAQSINTTIKLKTGVSRILHKSTEEVKTLKSMLQSNARATKAMNNLLIEMSSLSTRMERFDTSMEECRQKIKDLTTQSAGVITPQQANDPLLGATSLLQLHQEAEWLHSQVYHANRMLSNLQPDSFHIMA